MSYVGAACSLNGTQRHKNESTHLHSCSAEGLHDAGVPRASGLVQWCLSPFIALVELQDEVTATKGERNDPNRRRE